MANETLVYHPPKKEPSFFNGLFLLGAVAGAAIGLSVGGPAAIFWWTTGSAIANGIAGYAMEERVQRGGMKGESDKTFFNAAFWTGLIAFGLVGAIGGGLPWAMGSALIGATTFGLVEQASSRQINNLAATQKLLRQLAH